MKKPLIGLGIAVAILIAIPALGLAGRWFRNTIDHAGQRIDDRTRYETRKRVEDTARAMIANYTADRLTYEQYRDSDSAEQRSWASQARMRANRTAATYNEYILRNSYVWTGNVPGDILDELGYLE
jgi:alkylation response protein AidB-like acyl-CoA dehydrogenase